ncbi:MAG: hypothetical protein LBC21_05310, partial [Oscillospiraceae bacterium]|nr:hypothetical protein [Oscillospiraceae bacterium]
MPLIKKFLVPLCVFAAVMGFAAMPARAVYGTEIDEIKTGEIKVSDLTVKGNYVIAKPCSAVTFENTEIGGVVFFGGPSSGGPVTVNIGAGSSLGGIIINRPAALHNEGRIRALAVMSDTRIHSRGQ